MATAKEYPPVIPFCAVMFCKEEMRDIAFDFLKKELGEAAKISNEVCFSAETDYYDGEMGSKNIKKVYMVFKNPMKREYLADLKCKTNEFEQKNAKDGKRQINLDPGYITKDKFVLASAKDFSHRIAIGKGIFAETTLNFSANDKIKRFSWTYNDYLIPKIQELLIFGRNLLK